MIGLKRRRSRHATARILGVARVGYRTKDLARRIRRGEIAIIDHRDIDRVAAESLIAAGVAAVVNASESISGRYPNGGPQRLVAAKIPLLDAVGSDVMELVRDGEPVELRDEELWRRGEKLATGELLTSDEVGRRIEEARLNVGSELRAFARN